MERNHQRLIPRLQQIHSQLQVPQQSIVNQMQDWKVLHLPRWVIHQTFRRTSSSSFLLQAQRLTSKTATPEINEKKHKSPYSSLIEAGRTSFQHADDDASVRYSLNTIPNYESHLVLCSSSSSDELSLPSNHKRSDLSQFRKAPNFSESSSETNSKSQQQYNAILQLSIQKPEVLIGWKIDVPQYGRGVILDFQKKKFRSTKYRVLFDNQQEKLLKLKRSQKKGKVPFTFIEPMDGNLPEKWNDESLYE